MPETVFPFPARGKPKEEVFRAMRQMRDGDVNWRQGRVFSLVFYAGEDVAQVIREAYTLFLSENALNPTAFPSLRRMEAEVVAMSAALLGGDAQACGAMTSGGTESILMAVKTAREWAARTRPEIHSPEMVLPLSAHPAFDKAAHYFGVKAVRTPLRPDFRADVDAMRAAINPNTILLVGSAPSYPQGVVDPIGEISELALESNLLCHVDACVGGFMLPFVRCLGYPIPDFDFRLPGVTSISADLHKYGYAAKGASVILYRTAELRRCQFFITTDWPGGIYASPAMAGTRPGGAIAAAWAVLNYLGEEGYLRLAREVMQATEKLKAGINAIRGIKILSDPEMSVMAIGSNGLNLYEVGDEMSLRGWQLDRQHFPPCLHLTINYAHVGIVDGFLRDLRASAAAVRRPSPHKIANGILLRLANALVRVLPQAWVSRLMKRSGALLGSGDGSGLPQRSAAMYGMIGSLPNRGDMHELMLDLLDSMTHVRPIEK